MTCRTTAQPEAQPETKHGSPFDRGQADAYYGSPPIPHKTVKTTDERRNRWGAQIYVYRLTEIEVEEYLEGYRDVDSDPSFRKIYQ